MPVKAVALALINRLYSLYILHRRPKDPTKKRNFMVDIFVRLLEPFDMVR